MVAKFDGIGMSNDEPQGSGSIELLSPTNGDQATRIPPTEIAFEQKGDLGELTAIEFQYADPGHKDWSTSFFRWVKGPLETPGAIRMPAPFGVGKQPHNWRVWSVNKAGVVTLSEWRTIDFIN